ncbi:MAG: YlxR family protein [Lachnospiraceae bacterium]|nr:YlxR family protein [Lachnospiraceae bacterium]
MATVKKQPLRKCTGCGEMKDKKDLIRIIRTPEDNIELDLTGRKNGRGAYLCNSKECFAKARKNKGLERSLKMAVPAEIISRIEEELE